jgi:mannosyl-oligosaccharide alpha-1,2-mannosidase
VDALSTAIVIGNEKAVDQILDHIAKIDFTTTRDRISLFETTIRYLGGLLSAYDLLTGPARAVAKDDAKVKKVLEQAEALAVALKVAFDTPTGVPDNELLPTRPYTRNESVTNSIATIGTLVLEWTRLSDLTGNPLYGELAQKGESYLLDPKPKQNEPWPGLIGTNVNIKTGLFTNAVGGWVGGDDSFYEYLIKMYLYDPKRFAGYKDRWVLAADSTMAQLESHPASRPDLTFLAMYNNKTLLFISQHREFPRVTTFGFCEGTKAANVPPKVACFDGGNFILGGLTLNDPKYIEFGIKLTDSCHATYSATATKIGPETFRWQDGKAGENATNNPPPPNNQSEFAMRSGFWNENPSYNLRPEVIESYYYAYRATGDSKYQDWAWDAWKAINASCVVGAGFSAINDVNAADGGGWSDFQESYFFAETLKYSYLIQAEDADWQVQPDHSNKYVYNTECHPVLIPGGEQLR